MIRAQTIWDRKSDEWVVHVDDPTCGRALAIAVRRLVEQLCQEKQELVVLCIGTDRCTGDALGPMIGSHLSEHKRLDAHIYGTLDQPVHATNLTETIERIHETHQNPLIIAIDACLGRIDSVGNVTIGRGALKPGAGVNKQLPAVGDIYITGIVNVGGFMDYFVLQNTRLYLITRLAKAIAEGLQVGLAQRLTQVEAASARL